MKNLNTYKIYIFFASALMLMTGCERDLDEDLPLATYPTTAEIFTDTPVAMGSNFYLPFADAKPTAWSVDNSVGYESSASMRIDVPNADDPEGNYAGGILRVDGAGRDLSGYDALTFYAKASQGVTIDKLGFGTNYLGDQYAVSINGGVQLGTAWQKVIIPIPDPSKLTSERGLFEFAAGTQGTNGLGYTFWIDELKFEKLGTIAQPRPKIMNGVDESTSGVNGSEVALSGLVETFNLPNGLDTTVNVAPLYYAFSSSDESVATVNKLGLVTLQNNGTSLIKATLNGMDAMGSLAVSSIGNFVHAPTPTQDAADVISIYSDAYTNVNVEFTNGYWAPYQTTGSADFEINGDHILNYTNFNFVGVQYAPQDATEMDYMHFDIYYPQAMSSSLIITLKDFGADGVDGGDNDTTQSFTVSDNAVGSWISVDVPLEIVRNNMGQIIFEGGNQNDNFYVDNIYFYSDDSGSTPTEPTTAAPTPTLDASNVISLFSDVYSDVAVDTWRTDWSAADLEEVSVGGNATKKYSNLSFVGVETVANTIDASEMTHIHLDIWTPNASAFGVKLVDFGADGAYDGGDDVEHQIDFTSIAQGEWISYDIPLSDFTGLTTKGHLAQYIFVAQPSGNATVYIDNIYFHN